MNKRIRKKQLRRIICNMVAEYQKIKEKRKRLVRLALQEVVNAYGTPAFTQVLKEYLGLAALIPPEELIEYLS